MTVYAGNDSNTGTHCACQAAGRVMCGTGLTAAPTGTTVTCGVAARYVFVYKADAQFGHELRLNDGYLDLCQVQVWGY